MNISIDFDDTYTRDMQMWNKFIHSAQSNGHTIYCVTARSAEYEDEVLGVLNSIGLLIGAKNCIFTGRQAKRPFCYASSIHIHVWIDDTPEAIVMNVYK